GGGGGVWGGGRGWVVVGGGGRRGGGRLARRAELLRCHGVHLHFPLRLPRTGLEHPGRVWGPAFGRPCRVRRRRGVRDDVALDALGTIAVDRDAGRRDAG